MTPLQSLHNHCSFFCFVVFLVLSTAPIANSQVETLWSYGGDIGIHNLGEGVNIDGDDHADQLIYERANNKIKYLGWQRNTANRIGIIRMIDLPNWDVWSCGVIDIDQDGDGDLLLTQRTTGDLYVCYQVCPSEFEAPVQLEDITAQYGDFKVHDANGDGIDDLVGSSYNEIFRYYMQLGLGDGKFGPLRSLHIGYTEIYARRFQDLNSDGYTDITVTTGSGSRIVYYPGLETGGWGGERTVISGMPDPWASAIGDIDGDGHKDVIVSNFTGTNQPVYIAHNNGDNTFEKKTLFPSLLATTLLQCADINNDGKDEILLGGTNGADVWIYKNNGNFNFTKTKIDDMFRASGGFSDYDNDGYLDIVLRDLSFYPEKLFWWKGNGNPAEFELKGATTPIKRRFPSVYIANFNSDPIPDELIIHFSINQNDVYLAEGYGDGRFKEERLLLSDAGSVRAIDHNRDGKHDVITLQSGELFFHRNTGQGNLAPPVRIAGNIGTFNIIDTKRDGYPDYLYTKGNTDTLLLMSFEKTGISTTTLVDVMSSYGYPSIYDFNGDGFEDIAVTDNVADKLDIYLNRVHSFEKVYSDNQFTNVFGYVKAMDFDWDGIRDILLLQSNVLYWIKGFQDGTYGDLQLIPITGKIFSFELLDVADDAREEIVIISSETANGYYTVKEPAKISTRRTLYTYGDRIGHFADINLDYITDGAAQEYDSTIVWFISHKEKDFPYVLTNSPCESGGLVKAHVVEQCVPDYVIQWSDGTLGHDHPGLAEGEYKYFVVKEGDTIETIDVTIQIDPFRIEHVVTFLNEETQTGYFDIGIKGGLPPYAVSWKSGSLFGNIQTDLPKGIYVVTIVDAKGCSLDTTVEISSNNNNPLLLNADITHPRCYNTENGKINITVVGGKAPFLVEWTNTGLMGLQLSELAGGIYECIITDAGGNSTQASYTLNAPPILEIEKRVIPTTQHLANGVIELKLTGGTPPYHFFWDHDFSILDPIISNLSPGTYGCTIYDNNSCKDEITATVINTTAFDQGLHTNITATPNPVTGDEVIVRSITDFDPGTRYVIYDAKGKMVISDYTGHGNKCKIDVSTLLPGFYYLHLSGRGLYSFGQSLIRI